MGRRARQDENLSRKNSLSASLGEVGVLLGEPVCNPAGVSPVEDSSVLLRSCALSFEVCPYCWDPCDCPVPILVLPSAQWVLFTQGHIRGHGFSRVRYGELHQTGLGASPSHTCISSMGIKI